MKAVCLSLLAASLPFSASAQAPAEKFVGPDEAASADTLTRKLKALGNTHRDDCRSQAILRGIEDDDVPSFCNGAPTAEPVRCYLEKRAQNVQYKDAILLCRFNPIPQKRGDCYSLARQKNVPYKEALLLCRFNPSSDAPALCYQNARNANAPFFEALVLCRGAQSAENAPSCYRLVTRGSRELPNRTAGAFDAVVLCAGSTSPTGQAELFNQGRWAGIQYCDAIESYKIDIEAGPLLERLYKESVAPAHLTSPLSQCPCGSGPNPGRQN